MLFSQQTDAQRNLLKRANENIGLASTNPEKAFEEAKKIEKEAKSVNAREAELRAINIKCVYYKTNNDFEKLVSEAKFLFDKAKIYNMPVYQSIAKSILFDAYNLSSINKFG